MAQVTIQINGREYGIACGNGQEGHILRLAALLNEKATLLTRGNNHINENQLLAMIGLLLADELTDIKNGIAPQAQVQTVEKVVEKVVEVPVEKVVEVVKESPQTVDFQAIDGQIASEIKKANELIKMLASDLKS